MLLYVSYFLIIRNVHFQKKKKKRILWRFQFLMGNVKNSRMGYLNKVFFICSINKKIIFCATASFLLILKSH